MGVAQHLPPLSPKGLWASVTTPACPNTTAGAAQVQANRMVGSAEGREGAHTTPRLQADQIPPRCSLSNQPSEGGRTEFQGGPTTATPSFSGPARPKL